jgi:hypothetical protein
MLSIILGILLVIAIALYVKKTMDENDEDIIYDILADISRHIWAYDKVDVINFVRKIKTNDINNKERIDDIIEEIG